MFCLEFRFLFVFKQKTAYEMRISDWSSDVCSSDLVLQRPGRDDHLGARAVHLDADAVELGVDGDLAAPGLDQRRREVGRTRGEIGRAACRERVCQYV